MEWPIKLREEEQSHYFVFVSPYPKEPGADAYVITDKIELPVTQWELRYFGQSEQEAIDVVSNLWGKRTAVILRTKCWDSLLTLELGNSH